MAKQFKKTFSEAALNALGKAVGFCKRRRDITPYRLGLGLVEVFAAVLKRYCAHMAQRFTHLPISTQKVAKCSQHVLRDIFHALMHSPRQLNKLIMHSLEYLSKNAQRAHPKRDALTGRSKLGLRPVYEAA